MNASGGQSLTPTLSWKPGPWAHGADIYLGTTPDPPFYATISISPGTSTKKVVVSGLAAGTTYYWKIVSKTMAGKTATGPVWSFATGTPPPG